MNSASMTTGAYPASHVRSGEAGFEYLCDVCGNWQSHAAMAYLAAAQCCQACETADPQWYEAYAAAHPVREKFRLAVEAAREVIEAAEEQP